MKLLRNIGLAIIGLGALLYVGSIIFVIIFFSADDEMIPAMIIFSSFSFVSLGFFLLLIYVLLDRIKDARNEKGLYDYHNDTKGSRKGDH
ncbi:MAG: hypothetical protein ABH846_03970 [Patescibacteria group bacterium]